MILRKLYRLDSDFHGGIYLRPLGNTPRVDFIVSVDYAEELYLPLTTPAGETLEVSVKPGQAVQTGQLLGGDAQGRYLYAPRDGIVGETKVIRNSEGQSVLLVLKKSSRAEIADGDTNDQSDQIASIGSLQLHGQQLSVEQAIAISGIIEPDTGMPLAARLAEFVGNDVMAVVANAAPVEPSLNAPIAILHHWSEQVFAGLGILKTYLKADSAVMAHPRRVTFAKQFACEWDVRCVAVGEKYPQASSASLLRTLERTGVFRRRRRKTGAILVFDVQTLRSVERVVLEKQLPTRRIVTVSGDGVAKPAHYFVAIGTPVKYLLDKSGKYPDASSVVSGSSMTGKAIDIDSAFIGPISESFIVLDHVAQLQPERCIRCGWCLDDCPARIDPARMLQLIETRQYHRAAGLGLFDCLECGICSYTCPSRLRIMDEIIKAKQILRGNSDNQALRAGSTKQTLRASSGKQTPQANSTRQTITGEEES